MGYFQQSSFVGEAKIMGAFLAGMAAFGCVVAMNGCARPAPADDRTRQLVHDLTYAYDPATDICFATYEASSGTTLTSVPCTPQLRAKLSLTPEVVAPVEPAPLVPNSTPSAGAT